MDETEKTTQETYAIATKLLGWKLYNYETNKISPKEWVRKSPTLQASTDDGWEWQGREESKEAWNFSPHHVLDDAMEAVDSLNPEAFELKKISSGWEVLIDNQSATGKTRSEAITLALLKLIK